MHRLGVALAASLAALVVVGGLGAFAFWESGVAKKREKEANEALIEKQKALVRAESAEKTAMQSVDQFFTTVSESELIKWSKMDSLREYFLTLSEKYLKDLPKAGDDPEIKIRIARAHFLRWANERAARRSTTRQ